MYVIYTNTCNGCKNLEEAHLQKSKTANYWEWKTTMAKKMNFLSPVNNWDLLLILM